MAIVVADRRCSCGGSCGVDDNMMFLCGSSLLGSVEDLGACMMCRCFGCDLGSCNTVCIVADMMLCRHCCPAVGRC